MQIWLLYAGIAIVTLTCAEYTMALFFTGGCGSADDQLVKLLAATILRK